jgi:hypothetical protein
VESLSYAEELRHRHAEEVEIYRRRLPSGCEKRGYDALPTPLLPAMTAKTRRPRKLLKRALRELVEKELTFLRDLMLDALRADGGAAEVLLDLLTKQPS